MNSTAELISVVVTNYNHASYLDQRIESLLAQTYPNLEIIIVDNCSIDNSLDVLRKYNKYKNVQVFALPNNTGFVKSSNYGVSMSRGNFFIFAEADDYNAPAQIELLYKAMASNENIGGAFCQSFIVDDQNKIIDQDFKSRDRFLREYCSTDTFIPGPLAHRLLLFSFIIPNFSAVLIRRKYFDLAGGLMNHKACPEWDFWFRMSRVCDLYYLTTPLNYYRQHDRSYMSLLGIESAIVGIMEVLYTEARKSGLTFGQWIQFRINIGVIWGRYRKPSPEAWWNSFPSIWRQSLKYDQLRLVFLILSFLKRGMERMVGRA